MTEILHTISQDHNKAINNIAGYCADTVAGFSHEASSLDERYAPALHAHGIGDVAGLPALTVKCAIADFVLSTLGVYKRQFDVVRGHLEGHRRMTQLQVGQRLGGVTEVCVDEVLQNLVRNTRAMS